MKYISGIHALNILCDLDTPGDWHQSALNWNTIHELDSNDMFFKDYGIETDKTIPEHSEKYCVANHIRALLDLLQQGMFSVTQGMDNDFICNDIYNNEIFSKVYSMQSLSNWESIDNFMMKEYKMKWINYKREMDAKRLESTA